MITSTGIEIPEVIERSTFGFMVSHVLFTTQKLGIFDILSKAGSQTSDKLSKECNVPKDSLERLLIAAVSANFLEYKNNKFDIKTELQPFFKSGGLSHCRERFTHYETATIKLFQFLEDAIRENDQQWSKIDSNFNPDQIFDSIFRDSKSTKSFLENMWALGYQDSIDLCQQFSLKNFNHLVDLGGATGSFTVPALIENQGLTATIFDNESVKDCLCKKRDEYNLSGRLNFVSGDFFKDELPDADLFSLGYILSDWKKEEGTYLLNKIYKKLPNGGALLILEKIFDDDMRGPFTTAMMNLNMLLETYGKHRSFEEYKNWLYNIGFQSFQFVRSGGEKHMIVARKNVNAHS
ncbi:MAG: methyltransferase [Waddliaceae bacterium]